MARVVTALVPARHGTTTREERQVGDIEVTSSTRTLSVALEIRAITRHRLDHLSVSPTAVATLSQVGTMTPTMS